METDCICYYDLSFTVENVPFNGALTLELGSGITIEKDRFEQGMICRQADIGGADGGQFGYCGPSQACGEGLACDQDAYTCKVPCETDEECPFDPVATICEAGFCELEENW